MTLKSIPNSLSISRVFIAAALLILDPRSFWFLPLYGLCVLTDVLDGFLARKLDAVTRAGAFLDTIGDSVFVIAVIKVLLQILEIPAWLLAWALTIALVKLVAWGISYARLQMIFTHTYADRIVGVFLFSLVPLFLIVGIDVTSLAIITCVAASVSSIEGLVFALYVKEPREGVYSIFML